MDEKKPSRTVRFLRIQKECWLRSVTIFILYLMMGIIAFACVAIGNVALRYLALSACLLIALAYDAFLSFQEGKTHYDALLTGNLHRENVLFGIGSSKEIRTEKEYRFWKGFLIGFYVALPLLLVGAIGGAVTLGNPSAGNSFQFALDFLAGWAMVPVQLLVSAESAAKRLFLSLVMAVVPVVVTGVFYIVGAMKEKRVKDEQRARMERVQELAEQAKKK